MSVFDGEDEDVNIVDIPTRMPCRIRIHPSKMVGFGCISNVTVRSIHRNRTVEFL